MRTEVHGSGTTEARALARVDLQVIEGLEPGDEIVLHPGDRVRDGQRVTPLRI